MDTVRLPGTQLEVSRLIFGTASLFNLRGAGNRAALLEAAVDAGFTHFDTAPYYGFGIAERTLAPVLARHSGVGVTTKVGIYSAGGDDQRPLAVFLRKLAGRAIGAISRPEVDFAVDRARLALEGSLRRLRRDRIELYTLHEPAARLLDYDEWRGWLERLKAAGTIGEYGLALTADRLEGFFARGISDVPVVQTVDSLEGREADILARHGRPLQITYGYLSHALVRDPGADAERVLAAALERNRNGAIIVGTRRVDRLRRLARLAGG